jgi:hypothetical protein
VLSDPVAAHADTPSGEDEDQKIKVAGVRVGEHHAFFREMHSADGLPSEKFQNQSA